MGLWAPAAQPACWTQCDSSNCEPEPLEVHHHSPPSIWSMLPVISSPLLWEIYLSLHLLCSPSCWWLLYLLVKPLCLTKTLTTSSIMFYDKALPPEQSPPSFTSCQSLPGFQPWSPFDSLNPHKTPLLLFFFKSTIRENKNVFFQLNVFGAEL